MKQTPAAAQISPTPWIQVLIHPHCIISAPGTQRPIVEFPNTPQGIADATLTRISVNNHTRLVDALSALVADAEIHCPKHAAKSKPVMQARNLLASLEQA